MKTFEEALATVVIAKPVSEMTPDLEKLLNQELEAGTSRFAELLEQIHQNQIVEAALSSLLEHCCCPYHASLNALMMGVRIGMEMEKDESGGIDLETANANPNEDDPHAGGQPENSKENQ